MIFVHISYDHRWFLYIFTHIQICLCFITAIQANSYISECEDCRRIAAVVINVDIVYATGVVGVESAGSVDVVEIYDLPAYLLPSSNVSAHQKEFLKYLRNLQSC